MNDKTRPVPRLGSLAPLPGSPRADVEAYWREQVAILDEFRPRLRDWLDRRVFGDSGSFSEFLGGVKARHPEWFGAHDSKSQAAGAECEEEWDGFEGTHKV